MLRELAVWLCVRVPGLVRGANLQVGYRAQDAPVRCHTMLETGGTPNWYLSPIAQGEYMIQVLTRAADYQEARGDAWTIFNAINGIIGSGWIIGPLSSGGQVYEIMTIDAVSFPYYLGEDEKSNHEFTTNYLFRMKKK